MATQKSWANWLVAVKGLPKRRQNSRGGEIALESVATLITEIRRTISLRADKGVIGRFNACAEFHVEHRATRRHALERG